MNSAAIVVQSQMPRKRLVRIGGWPPPVTDMPD
jgi:hypothetical protein